MANPTSSMTRLLALHVVRQREVKLQMHAISMSQHKRRRCAEVFSGDDGWLNPMHAGDVTAPDTIET